MQLDDDLQDHPGTMRWLSRQRAVLAAYEINRRRREKAMIAIALAFAMWGITLVVVATFSSL